MICRSLTKSVIGTFMASAILLCTNYSLVSAISENEIDKFLDNLRLAIDLENHLIDNLRPALSSLTNWCPTIKLKDVVDELASFAKCEGILDPFVFYQADGDTLKSTQEICNSQAEITKSVSSAFYCTLHPMIRILKSCLTSVTTPETIDRMNSIMRNMIKRGTKEVFSTAFEVICKREDTIERLGELINEIGFTDMILLMACHREIWEGNLGKRKHPKFIQTTAECMVENMKVLVLPGKQGLCGLFGNGNINWQEYKKCLGDDFLVCDSEAVTKIYAYILENDEIYELLDKFICTLEDDSSAKTFFSMFDNWIYKSKDHKSAGDKWAREDL